LRAGSQAEPALIIGESRLGPLALLSEGSRQRAWRSGMPGHPQSRPRSWARAG